MEMNKGNRNWTEAVLLRAHREKGGFLEKTIMLGNTEDGRKEEDQI